MSQTNVCHRQDRVPTCLSKPSMLLKGQLLSGSSHLFSMSALFDNVTPIYSIYLHLGSFDTVTAWYFITGPNQTCSSRQLSLRFAGCNAKWCHLSKLQSSCWSRASPREKWCPKLKSTMAGKRGFPKQLMVISHGSWSAAIHGWM